MDVSVIVPVFNAARSLQACVEGMLQQDVPPDRYEVIVVDNNSTDASVAMARRYPTVRFLSEPQQGAYAARNSGIRAAAGRLLAFTDADCVPRSNWLSTLTAAMIDPRAMIVMGRDRPAGRSAAVRLLGEYDHVKEIFVLGSPDPSIYYGHTNNLMTRRDVFEHVGFFDERARGGDVIFVHRVLERYGTGAVRYEPGALVDHLEIDSAAMYFQKAFIYGRSARSYGQIVHARPLRNQDRLRIFYDTVETCRLSGRERSLLFALLAVGVGFYYLGWLSGRYPLQPVPAGARKQPT